jgi:WD40 repeat protein
MGGTRLWKWEPGREKAQIQWAAYPLGCRSLSFGPGDRVVASACGDGRVLLWDAVTGRDLQTLGGATSTAWDAIFSPDGRTVVSFGDECAPIVWDVSAAARNLPGEEETAKGQKKFWRASPPD